MVAFVKRGYARVSTQSQDVGPQRARLFDAGCGAVYQDICSGAVPAPRREGLPRLLDESTAGDTIVVTTLDRLFRDLHLLLNFMVKLTGLHLALVSLAEDVNTQTAAGRLGINLAGALATFERDRTRERTVAGLDRARANGVRLGRPAALDPAKVALLRVMAATDGFSVRQASHSFQVSRDTVRAVLSGEAPYDKH
jgi:DNA invertase Pin-like site-specific DNA recombinase